jgi:hypothetical protein
MFLFRVWKIATSPYFRFTPRLITDLTMLLFCAWKIADFAVLVLRLERLRTADFAMLLFYVQGDHPLYVQIDRQLRDAFILRLGGPPTSRCFYFAPGKSLTSQCLPTSLSFFYVWKIADFTLLSFCAWTD